jgi:hypothetical protein
MGKIKKEGMEEQQRRGIYGDVVIKHLNMSQPRGGNELLTLLSPPEPGKL